MGINWDDVAYERYIADKEWKEVSEEMGEDAIGRFISERYSSYFRAHPGEFAAISSALSEAKLLFDQGHLRPATVFAFVAIERTLRELLLVPALSGSTIDDAIAEIIIGRLSTDQFGKLANLVAKLVKVSTKVDLLDERRDAAGEHVMKEINGLQLVRNQILHGNAECDRDCAAKALSVANFLCVDVFGKVLKEYGFTVNGDLKFVVDDPKA